MASKYKQHTLPKVMVFLWVCCRLTRNFITSRLYDTTPFVQW